MKRVLVLSGLLFLLAGCALEEAPSSPDASPVAASPIAASPATGSAGGESGKSGESGATMPGMPGMPGMADPMAPLTPTPDLDKAVAEAQKSGDKTKLAAAYTRRGLFRMTDDGAGARVKYRAALSDLRKALAAEPGNKEAAQAKEQIEQIYTSMGRPVPTEDVP